MRGNLKRGKFVGGLLCALLLVFSQSVFAFLAPKYSITSHEFFNFTTAVDPEDSSKGTTGKQGRIELPSDKACMEENAESLILETANVNDGVKKVEGLLNRCHSVVYSGINNPYLDMLDEIHTNYRYEETGRFIGIRFRDTYGRLINAHLGLKNTSRPLPLVVFKCGVNCNLDSRTTRKAIMQFFDEGPFHILALPNMTGSDFVYANKQMGFGGIDEGRNLIEIARYVRAPQFPYSHLFSSSHVVGISLGGLATFYSALYHDAQIKEGVNPIVNSFTSACPVVDMESSVRGVFRNPLARLVFGQTIIKHARYIVDQQSPIKTAGDIFTSPFPRENLIDFFGQAYSEIWQLFMRDIPWRSAPFESINISNAYDFWAYNRFYLYAQHIQTPYLVWSPADDPVVLREENTAILEKTAQDNNLSAFHFINTDYGNHCSFATGYGWGLSGTVLRSFILRNTPELMAAKQVQSLPATALPKSIRLLGKGIVRRQLYMSAETGSPDISVNTVNIIEHCPAGKPNTNCWSTASAKISFESLGLKKEDIPQNQAQVDALTRWLNTNVRFVNEAGAPVTFKDKIAGLQITSYGKDYPTPH